jgi:pimeloyl-ACP methyl ester carboxylesterase
MSAPIKLMARHGLTLRVDDEGGCGTPVLFQHGLCGDANQTREAFPKSPAIDSRFRRITLECMGHGQSQAGVPELLSIQTFADDVAALIESLDEGPVVVGGISMGAAIALRLAVKSPGLVKGLILARPAWITANAPPNMEPNALVGALLSKYPPQEAHEVFMRSDTAKHFSKVAPDNLKSLQGFFETRPYEVTAALLTRISADGPGVEESGVRALAIPTLVIGQDRDSIHPYAYAQTLADLIPNSVLKTVTPKSISKELYISGFHNAIAHFLEELP